MLDDAEACRACALRCFKIAEKTPTPEDRCEFIGIGECWERLANEIQRSELLISLIDQLSNHDGWNENSQGEFKERQRSGTRSLWRLATAGRMMFDHLTSDHIATLTGDDEKPGQTRSGH
jgi:hypothetical protein